MSTEQTDREAILSLYKDWITAVEEGSREGYVALLDQDVRMTPPGAEDIISIKDYAEFLIPVLNSASYRVTPLGGYDIDIMDDLALARYDYIVSVSLNDGIEDVEQAGALNQQESSLKYSDVLRRQPDGGWKVLRHTWNDKVASNN